MRGGPIGEVKELSIRGHLVLLGPKVKSELSYLSLGERVHEITQLYMVPEILGLVLCIDQ